MVLFIQSSDKPDYEREQPWLQAIVKALIYPLLGILQLSEKAYSMLPGEFGSVVAGTVASSLIGIMYFTPFAFCLRQIKAIQKFKFRHYVLILFAVSLVLLISLLVSNHSFLLITTPLFVMTICVISSILSARIIALLRTRSLNFEKLRMNLN